MNTRIRPRTQASATERRGTITVLAAVMTIVMLGMVAFSVDLGYVLSNKQELQRTADAAAMAACWEFGREVANGANPYTAVSDGRGEAATYANVNTIGGVNPALAENSCNHVSGDVVFGEIADYDASQFSLSTANYNKFNAVTVKVRRDSSLNGEVPFFFAKIFGRTGQGLEAEATAGFSRKVKGFTTPGSGGNVDLLPYALDEDTWNDLLAGCADDDWTYNAATGAVTCGSDGVLEVNLFPQGTGSPGNRGTVDIGSANNSTADIARQIVYGVSEEDLAYHGGSVVFDGCGELELNGDTGISAGVKDELASIIGQPRMIPIFSQVVGPGNNAQYTIVKWAGIRIMEVKLTGPMKQKRVIVQPAPMVVEGVIPSTTDTSDYVYSPVVLVK
ncbi:MAG: hypothetical protein CMJ58_12125 [Planctomycetaceae bacterium]|nr:hypothetical protein [Planctomycetaceae bacterium]